jgi:hypothetical protein
MDEDWWELLQSTYTNFERSGGVIQKLYDNIENTICMQGFRMIEGDLGSNLNDKVAQPLWLSIHDEIEQGNEIIYMVIHNTDMKGVKVWDNTASQYWLVSKGSYYDGEYEGQETMNDHTDKELFGLEDREEMKSVDGREKLVKEVMFSRYHGTSMKMWFTSSIIIPPPYNMSWPKWLITVIRTALTKQKV